MPCYYPLKGWKSKSTNATGKRSIVFNMSQGFNDMPVSLPCGRCIGCRLERSRQWAIRMLHESKLHKRNCFITLTYNDEHLPEGGSLSIPKYEMRKDETGEYIKHQVESSDFQKFMKKLRKFYAPRNIRFFQCGEYGEKCRNCNKSSQDCNCGNWSPVLGRPHYHAVLFGINFHTDRYEYYESERGDTYYRSPTLESLWTDKKGKSIGFSNLTDVTYDGCAYVARYVMKKVLGQTDEAKEMFYATYQYGVDTDTGEILCKAPEHCTMSRRPGIGTDWYLKYKGDIYPHDYFTINGQKVKPPKFYDSQYELEHPDKMNVIKERRKKQAEEKWYDNTSDRLDVREKLRRKKTKTLRRKLKNEENSLVDL